MPETQPASPRPQIQTSWTSTQAYVLAAFCLVLGVALGYLFRGSASQAAPQTAAAATADTQSPPQQSMPQITPEQQKHMVETAVAPLLDSLKSNPNDFGTIQKVANMYYDGRQYTDAINYYRQAVKLQPKNPDIITDLGTAIWYTGDADQAIANFNQALKISPGHAGTLFNLGVVRWQGKHDPKGAVQAWEELLKANPNYPQRQQLEDFIAKAKEHLGKTAS